MGPFMPCPRDLCPLLPSALGCHALLITVARLLGLSPVFLEHAGLRQDMGLGWPTGMQTCLGSGTELEPSDPGLEGRLDMEQL